MTVLLLGLMILYKNYKNKASTETPALVAAPPVETPAPTVAKGGKRKSKKCKKAKKTRKSRRKRNNKSV